MNKNKIGFLIAVVGIAVALAFVLTDKSSSIWGKGSQFAVKDTANIVRIYMVDKNNQSIDFQRSEKGWVLNDHLKAHAENMRMLLKTLKSLEVKYPVPQKAHNNVVKLMAGNSVKVEVYKNDHYINIGSLHLFPYINKARVFYVGNATQDNMGTYMIIEGADRPYVVSRPGFRGFVAASFTTYVKDWMSHAIFRIPYSDIAEIKVENIDSPNKSFQIRKLTGGYEIMSLQSRQLIPVYDTVALYTFLDAFKNVNYESLLDQMPQIKIDSLLNSKPVHILNITETNGSEHELKTFRMRTRYDQEEIYGFEPDYDLDRLYAWHNGQMLMVQYFTFDKITRPIEYFYPHQQGSE
ncbi:MAG: DUF4340 domain-containing protein [Bacteroidales bacterium]|nr:DUF4340 domain-containing protein [Bacteroidales bacterium]